MSKHKKPTVSEIRAWSEMLATRQWDTQRISYLLGLLKRMEHTLEHAVKCGYFPLMLAQEASALVKESKQ